MSERVYTTIDKSSWGEGPWQDEPDKIQWKDEATGFPCLVLRNRLGAWCGYVGLSPRHPLHGEDYNALAAEVHGGLTYGDRCDEEGPEESSICHVPEPGEPDDVWWLGFDCAHGMDLVPGMEAREREMGWAELPPSPHRAYRDLDYVRSECADLARQLADLGNGGPLVDHNPETPTS